MRCNSRAKKSAWRSITVWVAAVAMIVVALPDEVNAEPDGGGEQIKCDQFMEAYLRSSARKLWRAISEGEYDLRRVDLDESLEVPPDVVETQEPVELEVFLEENDRIAGLIDRRREMEKAYLVARGRLGPIVVSQTWKPRQKRAPQMCEPIGSAVEYPEVVASSVDIEPFEFWGLRVSWRIPSPEPTDREDRQLEEVLFDVMQRAGGEE